MRKLFLIGMMLFVVVGLGMAQARQTIVNTFVPEEDCPLAIFALNGYTQIQHWEQPTIKINYRILAAPASTTELKQLIENGRYQVEMNFYEEERVMIFDLPHQEKTFLINEQLLEEYIEIEIFVPKNIKYRLVYPTPPLI